MIGRNHFSKMTIETCVKGDNGREGEKDEERGGGKLRKRGENGNV